MPIAKSGLTHVFELHSTSWPPGLSITKSPKDIILDVENISLGNIPVDVDRSETWQPAPSHADREPWHHPPPLLLLRAADMFIILNEMFAAGASQSNENDLLGTVRQISSKSPCSVLKWPSTLHWTTVHYITFEGQVAMLNSCQLYHCCSSRIINSCQSDVWLLYLYRILSLTSTGWASTTSHRAQSWVLWPVCQSSSTQPASSSHL